VKESNLNTIRRKINGYSRRGSHRLEHFCVIKGAKAILTFFFCALTLSSSIQAAEFPCRRRDADCLINAINTANTNGDLANTIILDPGNYVLDKVNNGDTAADVFEATGLPPITSNLTITGLRGPTATNILRLRATDTPAFRIFYVAPTGKLTLERLSVSGAFTGLIHREAAGAGIFIDAGGEASLTNVILKDNVVHANHSFGAGIYAATGTQLTVINSAIINNRIESVERGFGGGIFALGRLSIIHSTISGNKIFGENHQGGSGGGIFGREMMIVGSTINDNITSHTPDSPPGLFFEGGGGIYIANEPNKVFDTTIINSTITGNIVLGEDAEEANRGGGILNTGNIKLINVTISENIAPAAGGIFNSFEEEANEPTVTVKNTLIANNSTSNCDPSVEIPGVIVTANIISGGFNIDSDGTCGLGSRSDQFPASDRALLLPLANNGGNIKTQALAPGSPAIDTANCFDLDGHFITTDQRGVSRPKRRGCDIGAFESTRP
jgi:hypothetical protein